MVSWYHDFSDIVKPFFIRKAEKTVDYINRHILEELKQEYPSCIPKTVQTAYGAMSCV